MQSNLSLHVTSLYLPKRRNIWFSVVVMFLRGVHGLGGSGLCPTRKPTRKRSGSRFSTRNRPVKRVGFRRSVFRRVASISGEAETWQKTQKNSQNRRYLARSDQDPVRISLNPIIFPPNRVENLWIWCIYAGSDCFGRRNLPNQAENSSESMENSLELMCSGGSGFMGFEWGNSKPTCWHRVLELGTRGRPLEQSDRVNASRVWAGGWVGWTALMFLIKLLQLRVKLLIGGI